MNEMLFLTQLCLFALQGHRLFQQILENSSGELQSVRRCIGDRSLLVLPCKRNRVEGDDATSTRNDRLHIVLEFFPLP